MHEREYLARRRELAGSDSACVARQGPIARHIACPILVTIGEQGWLDAQRVTEMVGRWKADGPDITLKIFAGSETAAAQAHADNPTLANEFIFDWIAARLAAGRAAVETGNNSGFGTWNLRDPGRPSGRLFPAGS